MSAERNCSKTWREWGAGSPEIVNITTCNRSTTCMPNVDRRDLGGVGSAVERIVQQASKNLPRGTSIEAADVLASGLAHDLAPVARGAQLEDVAQKAARFLAARIVAARGSCFTILPADVVVKLELDQGRHGVVVVLGRIVVDVGLGASVA